MKKISYLELSSIFLVIITTFNSGININLLKNNADVNSYIAIIIAYIIGIIPVILTLYIANYKTNLNILEKNKHLFGDIIGTIVNIIFSLIIFIIGLTILYNTTSFITTQFMYRTPITITSIILIIIVIYCVNKEINVITHVSLILVTFNIILFLISNISIINEIQIDNLLPFLKINTNNFILSMLKVACINTLPSLIILIIPKDKITNPKKFNRSIIITYIVGSMISLIITVNTISVLGIYLTKIFEYSEYIVLKKIKLFGFLERSENIISLKWITSSYIYLTIIVYTVAKNIISKKENTFRITTYIIGLLLFILNNYLFKNEIFFNTYVNDIFIYIVSMLIGIYLLMIGKIIIDKYTVKE